MRPRQRQNARLLFITALFPLVACASSNARARADDPIEDDRDRVERQRDEEWERAERDRVERERVDRDRIERNTPSREIEGAAYPAGWDRRSDAPRTRLWIDGGESTYRPGDRVRALFRVERDAYVTVVRVDTDGRMRILFPRSPRESAWVMADHDYRVPGSSGGSFVVDDPTGLGYVFAITSFERFDYSSISYGRAWDYEAIGYRVTGDPFIAVRRLADRIAYDDRTGYATAYDEYYVGRHVDYPRSACYDCHAVGSPAVYDPYGHACPRVRIVVYDDPYYYPYRYYPGTRVVYAPRPRYESKPGGSRTPTPGSGGGSGGVSAGGYASGGTLVEHRRREEDVDLRRPGSPTSDPNVVARPTDNAGATRPGDDVIAPSTSERRRVEDVDATPPNPTRDGLGRPRRDGDSAPPPTGGNGGSSGGPGTGDEGTDRSRPSPRHDPGAPPAGNGDEDHGRPSDPRQEPRRGSSDAPRGATPPDTPSEQRGEPREQPRREAPAVEGDRRDDSHANERGGRRDEPRFDPPREAATRSEPPRPEPRRESARDDSPSAARSEPRMERRSEPRGDTRAESQPRAERRSEPKEERRSETKSEKRSEPRSEPKRESKGTSTRRRSD